MCSEINEIITDPTNISPRNVSYKNFQIKVKYNELHSTLILGGKLAKIVAIAALICQECDAGKSILINRWDMSTLRIYFDNSCDDNVEVSSMSSHEFKNELKLFIKQEVSPFFQMLYRYFEAQKQVVIHNGVIYDMYHESDTYHMQIHYSHSIGDDISNTIEKLIVFFDEIAMLYPILRLLRASPTKIIKILSQYLDGIDDIIDIILFYDIGDHLIE